jgi:hypothetical protein
VWRLEALNDFRLEEVLLQVRKRGERGGRGGRERGERGRDRQTETDRDRETERDEDKTEGSSETLCIQCVQPTLTHTCTVVLFIPRLTTPVSPLSPLPLLSRVQLVQNLKAEPYHDSALFRFLLRRALRNPLMIGHQLYWLLKSEMHNLHCCERYAFALTVYSNSSLGSLEVSKFKLSCIPIIGIQIF